MNRVVLFSALSLTLVSAGKCDVTLSQKVDGGPQHGEIVMRVKGDRLRIDLPGAQAGPMSTILDTANGDTITLIHQKKFAITRTGAQIKQAEEAKIRQSGGDPSKPAEPPKPVATGLTERVGEYDAEVYKMTVDGFEDTLWIVKDFPDFAAIKADLERVNRRSAGAINRAGTLDVTTLPGMVVKRQKERRGQKLTITLKSVSREPIDKSVFELPDDYKKVVPKPPAAAN